MIERRVALVTGANRGIGQGVSEHLARQGFHVILMGKDLNSLKEVEDDLKTKRLSVSKITADLLDLEKLPSIVTEIQKDFNKIDVLINNAGVLLEGRTEPPQIASSLNIEMSDIIKSFSINSFAPFVLMKLIIPIMIKNNYGRIVNVSSGMGSLEGMTGGWPAYRASKSALNAFTKIFADEVKAFDIKINAVCPGWVKTRMGGENATRDIEMGVQGILWAATLDPRGPSGGFFRDGKAIPW